MSKYIDLKQRIVSDSGIIIPFIMIGVEIALKYLDEHPDQVPGRTITHRQRLSLVEDEDQNFLRGLEAGLSAAGCTVGPDPEPTNAEKLEGILQAAMQEDGWGDEDEANILAAALEAAGVKAPGHD